MTMMRLRRFGVVVALGGLVFAATPWSPLEPALAQESNASLHNQIDLLKAEMSQMQEKLEALQRQEQQNEERSNAAAQAAQQAVAHTLPPNAPRVTESATHRFGLTSADGQNAIEFTGRLHLDTADYLNTHSYLPSARGDDLDSGINARRARIGFDGRFMGDWAYALIYDFGNTSDTLNINNYAAQNTKLQPAYATSYNSALSGLENAFITYNGFYNHGQTYPVAIDLGYLDVPSNLDEATSSNDIMFLERSSSQVVQTEFGGGDFRSAFGARSNNDRYWAGLYLTGPQSGALHSSCAATPTTQANSTATSCPTPEQMALVTRATYQVLQDQDYSLHLGVNNILDFTPRSSSNAESLQLYDRPELRVDPTIFLVTCGQASTATATGNTCKGINSKNADVLGFEFAGAVGHLYAQAEFYHYMVSQYLAAGETLAPTLDFNGGYAEVSYSFGGTRHYLPSSGAYTGVIPEQPLSFNGGGWGALEIAARYSAIDLNDDSPGYGHLLRSTGGVEGGYQQTWSIGLNYYPNYNMRFMLDFLHVNVTNRLLPNTTTGALTLNGGISFNAIAARTQLNF
jgi:phosphate-selective porin OprO and OprP